MPTEIFEDVLDIDAGMVETVPFDHSNRSTLTCYPYPRLKKAPTSQRGELRLICLENECLRVELAPDLGGRIVRLLDRRTGIEVLPKPSKIDPQEGGPRGIHWPYGIEFVVGASGRLNALGPVWERIVESEDSILIGELIPGLGVSWHAKLELPERSSVLRLELAVFNRGLLPVRCGWGVSCHLEGHPVGESALYADGRRAGLAIQPATGTLAIASSSDGQLDLAAPPSVLMPRERVVFQASVNPITGLKSLTKWSNGVGLSMEAGSLAIQADQDLGLAKVYLLTGDNETLESEIGAPIGSIGALEIPPGVAVRSLQIEDDRKRAVLRWEAELPPTAPFGPLPSVAAGAVWDAAATNEPATAEEAYLSGLDALDIPALATRRFDQAMSSPALKSPTFVGQAMVMLREKVYLGAAEHLESALLFNAEDHLAWWLLAIARRLSIGTEEERPELLNAHYLSPLEPALRVESFLSQTEYGREPNPIVSPLAEDPESLVECAVLLLEAGLPAEAARWIDECMRHREVPMLRYLQAWSLLQNSRMAAEAAEQVSAAGKSPLEPPFPWRRMERRAIRELAEKFPRDERLQSLAALVRAAYPSTC